MQPHADNRAPLGRAEIAAVLATVAVLMLSISAESFWTDEVTTATFAAQPTWSRFWDSLATTGSEMQMPLYAHYMWVWARVFGAGELSLRCANLPWMGLLVAAVLLLLARHGGRRVAVLLLAAPLVCQQMNEARPYIMTMATSALALYGLECLLAAHLAGRPARRRHAWLGGLAVWACVAISMLNLFLVPALAIYALVRWKLSAPGLARAAGGFLRGQRAMLTALAVGLAALLVYFLWTLQQGHGGMRQPFTLSNLGFAIYEWAGFGGLGLPRNLLREAGPAVALREAYPTLALGILAWMLVALHLGREWRRLGSDARLAGLIWGGKAGAWLLIAVALAMPASIWGRHFLFAWPLIWIGLARWILPVEAPARGRRGRPGWLAATAFAALIAVFLLSSGRQRFDPAFGKDPYREVVAALRGQLREFRDLPWVWTAYPKALRLYGGQIVDRNAPLAADDSKGHPALVLGDQWPADEVQGWVQRQGAFLLVLHRPDVTDPDRAWSRLAHSVMSELVWERGNMRVYRVAPPALAPDRDGGLPGSGRDR